MAGGGLLRLWSEHGVQIMVLGSFALQVFLLARGGTRRRSSSAPLRISLWLAYLFADSTAIYALGHLSVASGSASGRSSSQREHPLVAFWAPFLLLHLGGPDNITAYALEDNRLWLRHLQTLAVQAVGAAYVVYKYIAIGARGGGAGTLLLLAASICMFAAGLVKYGERVWALKCGNISSSDSSSDLDLKISRPLRRRRRSMSDREEENSNNRHSISIEVGAGHEEDEIIDDEEILLRAHSHLDVCKGAFTDASANKAKHGNPLPSSVLSDIADLFKLVEMELSLLYDILYTKAAVIHTWYGIWIHSVSLLATAAAFMLFQLSIVRGEGYNKHSSRVDVVISYVLLAGALALEAMSLCRAILSSWTSSLLVAGLDGSGWKRWLLAAIISLRRRARPASRRLWRGSIGQYNLLDLSASDRSGLACWLAEKAHLESWWNKLRFSATFSGTELCTVEDLKVLVLRYVALPLAYDPRAINSRGAAALERSGCGKYKWSADDMDLDKSIVVWHVVTDLVVRVPMDGDKKISKRLVEATRVLSNYMMYLLVEKPDMLPDRTRRSVYLDACKELGRSWRDCSKAWNPGEEQEAVTRARPRADMLADWLLADLYHTLRKDDGDGHHHTSDIEGRPEAPEHAKNVYNAIWIYEGLRKSRPDKVAWLQIIFHVWVEMMMYVAEHCSRHSHARQLSRGGEFMTIMWLTRHHLKFYSLSEDFEIYDLLYSNVFLDGAGGVSPTD